jgi:hypothetical protein
MLCNVPQERTAAQSHKSPCLYYRLNQSLIVWRLRSRPFHFEFLLGRFVILFLGLLVFSEQPTFFLADNGHGRCGHIENVNLETVRLFQEKTGSGRKIIENKPYPDVGS